MKEGRKPEYFEKTPDNKLQKIPRVTRQGSFSLATICNDKFQHFPQEQHKPQSSSSDGTGDAMLLYECASEGTQVLQRLSV